MKMTKFFEVKRIKSMKRKIGHKGLTLFTAAVRTRLLMIALIFNLDALTNLRCHKSRIIPVQ